MGSHTIRPEFDMFDIQGFVSMPSLAINTTGVIAPFGELSLHARTFSRDRIIIADPVLSPSTETNIFLSVDSLDNPVQVVASIANRMNVFNEWLYQRHISAGVPANASLASFVTAIQTEFPDFLRVTIGEILIGSGPSRRMPDYVKFSIAIGATEYRIKLWYSDAKFRTQYENFEIFIIPPCTNIDLLNTNTTAANAILHTLTPAQWASRVNVIAGAAPYTKLEPYEVVWHDPNNPDSTLVTGWTAVVYGQAGADTDAIRNAIRAYIAANTTLTNWNVLLPDLYAENEFIIIPLWSNVAAPANALEAAMYSSGITVGTLKAKAVDQLPVGYGQSVQIGPYLDSNLEVLATPYRAMMLLTVGNPNNLNAVYRLKSVYPDYMAIATNAADFARMSPATQAFVVALSNALEQARKLQESDLTPPGYIRSVRGNHTFLGFSMDGYFFHILTRVSGLSEG